MQIKRILLSLLICICMTGCTVPTRTLKEKELEPFHENEAKIESEYEMMSLIKLENEEIKIETYLPSGENLNVEDSHASSFRDGVSVNIDIKKETDPKAILHQMYEKEKNRIKSLQNMKNFKVYDVIEGEGYWLIEMNYHIEKDNMLYPCLSILKVDIIEEEYYLSSVLQLDNTKANENTKDVVKEMMEIYGINMKE